MSVDMTSDVVKRKFHLGQIDQSEISNRRDFSM